MTVGLADYLDRTVRVVTGNRQYVGRLRFDVDRKVFYVLSAQGNRAVQFAQANIDSGSVSVSLYGAGGRRG